MIWIKGSVTLIELDQTRLPPFVRFGVIRVDLTVRRSLPDFPHKRTFSGPVGMSQTCQQETHAPQQTTALFDHELLRRCDDSKSSIAPILNGPKNSGLHGNVLDRRRI